jgi:hypothetical protein
MQLAFQPALIPMRRQHPVVDRRALTQLADKLQKFNGQLQGCCLGVQTAASGVKWICRQCPGESLHEDIGSLNRHFITRHPAHVLQWICADPAEYGRPLETSLDRPLETCVRCRLKTTYSGHFSAVMHLLNEHIDPPEEAELLKEKWPWEYLVLVSARKMMLGPHSPPPMPILTTGAVLPSAHNG